MLRITVINEPESTRLKLEGKLVHEWVREAGESWTAISNIASRPKIIVDLRGVSFVDESGTQLLAAMRHAGAELVGSGPLISALIEGIEEAEKEAENARKGDNPNNKWPQPRCGQEVES